MGTEEVKLNNKTVIRTNTDSTTPGSVFRGTAKSTIDNIFSAFEEFAKKRGVSVKAEDFQSIFNAHPEIFEQPLDKQADAIVNILVGDKAAETTTAPNSKTVTETPAETTTQTSSKVPAFGFLSAEDAAQLKQVIDESLNKIEQNNTVQNTQNQTETAELKKEVIPASASDKEAARPGDKKENLYNDCIMLYAKNYYMYGKEKHTEEEWNNLSEDEIKEFINNNKIKELATSKIKEKNDEIAFISKKDKNETIEFTLKSNLLLVQAASAKNLTVEEFQKLDKIERGAAIVDILTTKDAQTLTHIEKETLERAQIFKDAIAYMFENNPQLSGTISSEALKNMSYSEIYAQLKYANQAECLSSWVMQYLEEKPADQRTKLENDTLSFLKTAPVASINNFGTESGLTELETAILQDNDFAEKYNNLKDPEQKAQLKVEYFQTKYGLNPEMYIHCMEDAIKHGNVYEISAFAKLLDRTDIDVSNIRKALETSELGVIVNSLITNHITLTQENVLERIDDLDKKSTMHKVVRNAAQRTTRIITSANSEHAVAISETMPKLNSTVAKGVLDGAADAVRNGNLGATEFSKIGENAGKCSEEVQDHAVEIAGDKTIESEARGEFTIGLVKNSGYAATKCVEKHIPATFDDNSEVQQKVFSAMQTSLEVNLSKEKAVKILKQLADQVSELNEENQAEAHERLTNGKYEEVAVHAASNIHTYAESAQAEALKTSYASGNTKIIEAATLQVDKMAEVAVNAMKKEIAIQINAMEERHAFSAIEEYAIRQLKKQLGFEIDITKPEFKTRLERYLTELKQLSRTDLYKKICTDIQSWPTDKKALIIDAISKYCPELFGMLLEKFGINLLSSFGQINSSTRNAILTNMLKNPSMRSEAMAYMRANSNLTFSDELMQLYNETYDLMVACGAIIEDEEIPDKLRHKSYQSVPSDFTSTQTLTDIGYKYNWNMKQDIDGNIGLIS